MTEDASVDSENIIFWGIKEGAEICWITAGIDNRVKAIVPVLDYGYTGYKPPKFSKNLWAISIRELWNICRA